MDRDDNKLRILLCIGGGPEAFTGLKFVHRLTETGCADIVLLYVRPIDSGLKSGGMEVRVARENLLDWGIELPGMAYLRKARDILSELGGIQEEVHEEWLHKELSGDPAGEFVRDYLNPCGGIISLRLRTASDITTTVVDEAKRFKADFVIVGGSPEPVEGLRRYLTPQQLALKIAAHSPCSIIVARHLEPGHGLLVCVQDSSTSREMLPEAIRYSLACDCPVSLLSVAVEPEEEASARKAVEEADAKFRANGITPTELLVETGDPAEVIAEIGYDFSLIIMAESLKPWFARVFSVSHDVVARARNSVMIVK